MVRTSLAIVAVLTLSGDAVAQQPWIEVQQLKIGTRVRIGVSTEPIVAGKVLGVTDDALRIEHQGHERWIPRRDIREIRLDHRLGVAQYVGLGLLAGGMTGYALGRQAACDSRVCGGEGGMVVAGGTLYGLLNGGLGGFVVGKAVRSRPGRVIYSGGP